VDLLKRLMPVVTLDGKEMSQQDIEDDVAGPQPLEFAYGKAKNHQVLYNFAQVDASLIESLDIERQKSLFVSGAAKRGAAAKTIALQRQLNWRDEDVMNALREELAQDMDETQMQAVLNQNRVIEALEIQVVRAALVMDGARVVSTLEGVDLANEAFWRSAHPLKAIIAKALWAKYPTGRQEPEAPIQALTGKDGSDQSSEASPNTNKQKRPLNGTASTTGLDAPLTATRGISSIAEVTGPISPNGQADSNKSKNTATLPIGV
jgi:hypothetical protein